MYNLIWGARSPSFCRVLYVFSQQSELLEGTQMHHVHVSQASWRNSRAFCSSPASKAISACFRMDWRGFLVLFCRVDSGGSRCSLLERTWKTLPSRDVPTGFPRHVKHGFFGMYPYASSRTELVSVWWDWGGCQEGPVIPNLRERHARFGVPSRSVYEWVGFRNRAPPPCLSPPNTWTVDSGPFRELLSFAKKRRPGTTPCFRLRAVPSNTCWSIKPIAKPSVSGFLGHTKHGTERLV